MIEAKHPWSIVKIGKRPLNILPEMRCQLRQGYSILPCKAGVTSLTFVDGKLLISYSDVDFRPRYHISSVDVVFTGMEDVVSPASQPSLLRVNRFPDENPDGPVDDWLQHITIPAISTATAPRVALVCVWNGKSLPEWIDYFVLSSSYAADKGLSQSGLCHVTDLIFQGIDVVLIHSNAQLPRSRIEASNVRYIHVSVEDMAKRLISMFDGMPIEGVLASLTMMGTCTSNELQLSAWLR